MPDATVLRYTNGCEMMNEKKPKVFCTYYDAPDHHYRGHPESPQRLEAMVGWAGKSPYPEIQWLDYLPATEADVRLIHTPSLLDALKSECELGAHHFESAPSYVTEDSYTAVLEAVGATLAISREILSAGEGIGFAIVRPPGHHAEPDAAMGFCLLNNVAIVAADAVASGLSRVAIFDFDAHHGNGTEAAFINTPEVGCCSVHESNIYPGTGDRQSKPLAAGRLINVPLPAFSGNTAFNTVINQIVEPWLAAFRPEMLLVSAGFDAHFSDPLTSLTMDTQGFYDLTKRLVKISEVYCENRLMFVLEGGYDLIALKDNIQACLAALSGRPTFTDHYGKGPDVHTAFAPIIEDIRKIHLLKET